MYVIIDSVIRFVTILEGPRLDTWEKDIAVNNINQSIDKLIEWQSFTVYSKKIQQKMAEKSASRYAQTLFKDKNSYKRLNMEPIREEYDE